MSIFMAFFVLLLLFEGNMPPASDKVPILGKSMQSVALIHSSSLTSTSSFFPLDLRVFH